MDAYKYTHLTVEQRVETLKGIIVARENEMFLATIEIAANEALFTHAQPPRTTEIKSAINKSNAQLKQLRVAIPILRAALEGLEARLAAADEQAAAEEAAEQEPDAPTKMRPRKVEETA